MAKKRYKVKIEVDSSIPKKDFDNALKLWLEEKWFSPLGEVVFLSTEEVQGN